MWEAIGLSFGLAMDATAVSAARGLAGHTRRELVILPATFGGFQAAMAALGWLTGRWAGSYIAAWESWVAFALLVLIGLKMLRDAWRERGGHDGAGDEGGIEPGTIAVYLGLGLATSIDAAAAGLTLPLIPVAPWLALVLIGGITAACSAAGYLAGRALGSRAGSRFELLGGVVLIALGISMVVR